MATAHPSAKATSWTYADGLRAPDPRSYTAESRHAAESFNRRKSCATAGFVLAYDDDTDGRVAALAMMYALDNASDKVRPVFLMPMSGHSPASWADITADLRADLDELASLRGVDTMHVYFLDRPVTQKHLRDLPVAGPAGKAITYNKIDHHPCEDRFVEGDDTIKWSSVCVVPHVKLPDGSKTYATSTTALVMSIVGMGNLHDGTGETANAYPVAAAIAAADVGDLPAHMSDTSLCYTQGWRDVQSTDTRPAAVAFFMEHDIPSCDRWMDALFGPRRLEFAALLLPIGRAHVTFLQRQAAELLRGIAPRPLSEEAVAAARAEAQRRGNRIAEDRVMPTGATVGFVTCPWFMALYVTLLSQQRNCLSNATMTKARTCCCCTTAGASERTTRGLPSWRGGAGVRRKWTSVRSPHCVAEAGWKPLRASAWTATPQRRCVR